MDNNNTIEHFNCPNVDFGTFYESLEEIIFNLREDNIQETIKSIIDLSHNTISRDLNIVICKFTYSLFQSQMKDFHLYFKFLEKLENKDKEFNEKNEIMNTFSKYLRYLNNEGSLFLLGKMIELNMINIEFILNMKTLYFAHYLSDEELNHSMWVDGKSMPFFLYFIQNIKELSNNDWELHKKYIKEGHNPNEIAKIIRNDEIEKFQEISSQTNFDFNQKIEPSLYERYSFINQDDVTLIDYAAFFGSVKCFKYLLMNNANVNKTGKYAVAGGNEEIIYLCEQNHSSFEGAYEAAMKFHRNDIFHYLYENKFEKFRISFYFFTKNLNNSYLFVQKDIISVKLLLFLLKQKEININVTDIYLFYFIFILII